MNNLIVGCGKFGANLCNKLSGLGHDISVISSKAEAFSELSSDFNGYTTVGVPIDQDVLRRAGVESCDAVAAVTNDDNVNLMVVQLTKEFFHVENSYARVSDPIKNDIFTKMGIKTFCPTNIAVETLSATLSETNISPQFTFGDHSIILTYTDVNKKMIGKRITELLFEDKETIFAVEHEDKSIEILTLKNYEIMKGDKLICAKFVD